MARTILVTGLTGFIAKRIAYDLLGQGDSVRGTLRNATRADEVRQAMAPLGDAALERLGFVEADLLSDDGWAAAMEGVDAVIHAASPFPLASPRDENAIIRPAVEGTERVLRAAQAAGVTRVVLTSSMEAVMHGVSSSPLTEADWSDPDAASAVAYTRSKIFAERAAWDFVKTHPEMQLTVVNPGMVCGTPMDRHTGSSVAVIERFMSGRDPMVPNFSLPVVDIEDVSACHVRALDCPAAIGKRYICAEDFLSAPDMARVLADAFPDRKISTRVAPNWLVRLLGVFDSQIRIIRHFLEKDLTLTHGAAAGDLDVAFAPAREAVLRTGRFLAAAQG